MKGYAGMGTESSWNKSQFASYLNGAPLKMKDIAHFYVGDTVTSLQRCRLMPNGDECIVYATVLGQIGVLVPFRSKTVTVS